MTTVATMTTSGARSAIAFTADPHLAESLARLAAVADAELQVHAHLSQARGAWSTAGLVIIGADALEDVVASAPPRRSGVLVLRADDADVWRSAVTIGAEAVWTLPESERAIIDRLVNAGAPPGHEAPVVSVIGGTGGAGASTFAVALARTGAARLPGGTLLIDGDPLGGGLELLVEAEDLPGVRWRDLGATRGRVSPEAVRGALPHLDGLSLLSHDRLPGMVDADAWEALLTAGQQGFDLTVVDLARGASGPALTRATLTLLVVPADLRAVAATVAQVETLRAVCPDLRAVVRRRRDSDLDREEIEAALELSVIGEYSDTRVVSLERVAESILARLGVVDAARRGRRQAA